MPDDEAKERAVVVECIMINPGLVGLTGMNRPTTCTSNEMPTGEATDALFELRGDRYAVLAVEPSDAMKACNRALGQKVLKCADLGRDIDSDTVLAIAAAHRVEGKTALSHLMKFCKRYAIRFVEYEFEGDSATHHRVVV